MMPKIWIADDDSSIRWAFEKAFEEHKGIEYEIFNSGEELIESLKSDKPELVLTDVKMNTLNGIDVLNFIKSRYPKLPVILMSAFTDLDSSLTAFQHGATEFISKPFDLESILKIIDRTIKKSKPPKLKTDSVPKIIGKSKSILPVFNAIGKLALTNSTVLIIGESGTGKELVAESLHLNSKRSNNSFIALNTPAIPKELLESELFGHEKGSFTGANNRRIGRFEQASKGTLFLDEIGDMPLELQTRLLRVLSDSSFYRVGGIDPIKTNTRLITATNKNLESLVADGLFREDLYHRLNVIKINLPPLRERLDDIPDLLEFFLEKSAIELKIEKKVFCENAIKRLKKYYWPGNIRQLQNLCHFATIMTPVNEITYEDIPQDFFVEKINNKKHTDWENNLIDHINNLYHSQDLNKIRELSNQFDKTVISTVLKLTNGKKVQSSEILGLGRNTLTRKILDLKIST